jgi:UTP--glucose-1-phosphate uridylyltransferase
MDIKNKITQMMAEEALPQLCADVFLSQYAKLAAGEESVIREKEIQAISKVDDLEDLPDYSEKGESVLSQALMLKLNGGLGTGMGLEKAKSLLVAKEGLSFLEIIIKQVLSQRENFDSDLPLVFMNSFSTETDTLAILNQFPKLLTGQKGIPLTFVQNKVPKLLAENLEPVEWPTDPSKVWCPPGHGDIYTALQTSGILDQLLNEGIKYAFISNSDNLGASMDLSVLGYFAEQDASFMMEVADRTAADRKGGHLAQFADGRLMLRESAQCHKDDSDNFQDINQYKYFNTNNLWIRLDRLKQRLTENNGILDLPLIQNTKTVDPRNPDSPKVFQLETAMGAAISSFDDSIALRIPKTRFAPIKTTSELLGLWSNAFVLDESNLVVKNPERSRQHIVIKLDDRYFKKIDDMQARFPDGIPDLLECDRLTISGDVKFGSNVKVIGNVVITNDSDQQLVIESSSVLEMH